MRKVFTVAVLQVGDRVLLGYKKTKIGKGYWNGFGGRVEEGESPASAAAREFEEESGLVAERAEEYGHVDVLFRDTEDVFELRIFRVTAARGEPRESREMRPQWFSVRDVPYEQMWASDRLWLPLLLSGKHFAGTVWFDNLESRLLLDARIQEATYA
jgi:ADP-ribose pyrophosphatase YjhB (NUDIX family)